MKKEAVLDRPSRPGAAATALFLVALSFIAAGCLQPSKFVNDGGAATGGAGLTGEGGADVPASTGGQMGTGGAPMAGTGGGASAGTGGAGGLGGTGGVASGTSTGGDARTGGASAGGRGGAGGRSTGGAAAGGASTGGSGTGGSGTDGGASDASADAPPPLVCPTGSADCNGSAADGCEQRIDTDQRCGACNVSCTGLTPFCQTTGTGSPRCVNPAAALNQQRLETPCTTVPNTDTPEVCDWQPIGTTCPATGMFINKMVAFGGRAGAPYDVTIRVRGVVEPKVYTGGRSVMDRFYVGGQPTATKYNVMRLTVSSPPQVFYLNADEGDGESHRVFLVDHMKTIRINGGAGLTLEVSDTDCKLVRNCQSFTAATCTPFVVPGIPPAPVGFNGQFVQFDVVSIANAATGTAAP